MRRKVITYPDPVEVRACPVCGQLIASDSDDYCSPECEEEDDDNPGLINDVLDDDYDSDME